MQGVLENKKKLQQELDALTVRTFEERYDRILDKVEEEYLDNPPNDYYREGYINENRNRQSLCEAKTV